MTSWIRGIFLAIFMCAGGPTGAVATDGTVAEEIPTITGLRYGTYEDRVRITFDVTPTPAFTVFTLNDPDRLVIDFPAMDWLVDESETKDIPFVSALRHGLFHRERARVVAMLTAPVRVDRIFTKQPSGAEPGRLVLDLAPVSREAFDRTAGWPELARWKNREVAAPDFAATGDLIIALDPGHGGIDPGASVGGVTEKEVVLDFAKRLAMVVNEMPGYAAVLTREDDVFIPLAERVAIAHQVRANLFISIHADSLLSGVARGVSIYTLSERGSDDAAEALALRENRADVLAGADLGGDSDDITRLLIELAQRGTSVESVKLAQAMIGALRDRVELLRTNPHRQANFRVLKAPDIPSILMEIGFLNSKTDRDRMTDPRWQNKAAVAVFEGIKEWTAIASPGFLGPR
ncbi:MAG: N-acetylmuramoyl-L-alanine amidase [Pseudomonadota bacterium]